MGLVVALLVMFVGLAGSIVPALPSTPLILIAAIGHKLWFGTESAEWWIIGALVVLTGISLVLDHLVSAYGAKRFGATWRGVLGAILGGIVGMFLGIVGLLLGPFIGAAAFELMGRRTVADSSRAGLGATLGLIAAAVAKLACCVVMMGLFTVDVVF